MILAWRLSFSLRPALRWWRISFASRYAEFILLGFLASRSWPHFSQIPDKKLDHRPRRGDQTQGSNATSTSNSPSEGSSSSSTSATPFDSGDEGDDISTIQTGNHEVKATKRIRRLSTYENADAVLPDLERNQGPNTGANQSHQWKNQKLYGEFVTRCWVSIRDMLTTKW